MLSIAAWLGLVVLGISAMQWGAAAAADLLEALRDKYGLPATAGGALMGLATAAPETAVNTSSVAFGWPDLGLGTALGSNVPALPLAFALAYLATRLGRRPTDRPDATVQPEAVGVQVLPYLGVVALLAVLTLPPPWSGLQPIDGGILLAAWAIYFGRAVLRRPWSDCGHPLPAKAIRRALATGLPALAVGAMASVLGAQKVGAALGWPDLVVGLFLIGSLCAVPEAYSAWRFARQGRPTVAVSSATADGIVSLTLALLPPALVGAATGNVAVYAVNLAFLGLVLTAYAALSHRHRGQELGPGFVAIFGAAYLGYVAVMAGVLARSG